MRVLIATGIYPPDIGGPATYSKLLSDHLPAGEFRVKVFSFGGIRTFPKGIRHLFYFFSMLWKGAHADIIFSQDAAFVGFCAFVATILFRKKLVVKVVGDYAWEQGTQRFGVTALLDEFSENKKIGPLPVKIFRRIQTLVAKRAERVITPSRYLKKIVTTWGVDPEHITVIHNAFVLGVKNVPSKDEARHTLGLRGQVIVTVGRLVPWKGFAALIELFADMKGQLPDPKLLIVGSGPDQKKLEALIKKHKAEQDIKLIGGLPQDELFAYIKAADAFVLNTAYEGLSHQLLEVMYIGTPIVTTNVGGNPELIENGTSGLLVSYNDKAALKDAIVAVARRRDYAERFTIVAHEKIKEFAPDMVVRETAALLRDVAAS